MTMDEATKKGLAPQILSTYFMDEYEQMQYIAEAHII